MFKRELRLEKIGKSNENLVRSIKTINIIKINVYKIRVVIHILGYILITSLSIL